MQDGFCELGDAVILKPLFGVIRYIFNFVIKYELDRMFAFRHKITKNEKANNENSFHNSINAKSTFWRW